VVVDTIYTDERYILDEYFGKAFRMYFKDCSVCVLDIETTGMTTESARFVLGGLLSFEDGVANLIQYFAEDISEEKEILTLYIQEAFKYDVILTYNGKSFDLPFLLARADKLELDVYKIPYNLDLYLVLNGHSPLRKFLPNLKQKTVEDFMGLWEYREDRITGREFALMYPNNADLLLLHNRDDVLQLARLLAVLEKTNFHRAMYSLGFPVIAGRSITGGNIGRSLHVQDIMFHRGCLRAAGLQAENPVDFISYGDESGDFYVRFVKKGASFEISVPVFKLSGSTVVDLKKLPFDVTAELSAYPNYESEYLILKSGGDINHMEVNLFIKAFLQKTLGDLPEDLP